MFTYNVGFYNSDNKLDETQLNADTMEELHNLIDSLREELDIREILYIEQTEEEVI